MTKRRVVITGLGIVSPVGNTVEGAWENILAGRSGIRTIDTFDTEAFSAKFAGLVNDFDITPYMSAKEARKCDPFIHYGFAAAVDAVQHAGLALHADLDKDRVGVCIGSGIGGLWNIQETADILKESGPRRISPFFIPATIINMIAGHVSIRYGYRGPNLAIVTACTTGTHSIGIAARSIMMNDADVMVAGGAEYACTPLGLGGFAALRALSTRNDAPTLASRPWDKDRDGFVLGDGAGVLVLEEYEHAMKRGATILAELAGFGMSGDAFHMTRPSEGGVGAARAIEAALRDAAIAPSEVDYINAHGTSTPAGDLEEIFAVKLALKEAATQISMSSTKSMTGHLLGAAGAVEAIFSILAIRDQVAPPTINLFNPDEHCDLDLVPHVAKKRPIRVAMSNSFGFGGTNGTLVFKKL
ncbi:MAG: beta-ketoacyl-ACP synthase II [Gammaproteobacteria bacterium]|nr:beta-ketoacyl-ACP synthase II [Gammaproteobacteria bacterium]MBP9729273.1 beta-ketoacyl-ACP synthase II [Gammaproteobacteria bacterium]